MKSKNLWQIRSVLFMVSLVMIGYGVFRNEVSAVLSKAIKICLECIGVG
ncbi:MAG: CD1871A family CXXC motif-containing protein [Firmicutes bacterium]|jgi:hypothetical protein|nr:CD1871A family CXXC motif-containing protein [Bacillota bacterium]